MVGTILETEKIYVSNKIQNINKIAVQAKNCELLTLFICVCFFYYYFSLCRLRAFWQKLSDFSKKKIYYKNEGRSTVKTFISEIKLHAKTYFVYSLSSNNKHFYDDRD